MTKYVFNGKFLMASPTGVHRVAEELINATDRLIEAGASEVQGLTFEIAAPRDIKRDLPLKHIPTKKGGLFTWIMWEQFDLPRLAGKGISLNLCNLGPGLSHRAVTMIHDAQVHITPASYSKGFRLWYKFIQPLIAKRHKLILTVSDYSKQQLVHYGVAPAHKIAVVHNGVDHILSLPGDETTLATFGLTARKYVVALANTQSHKNIKVLLKAFKDPALKDIDLVLFGGASREALTIVGEGALSDNIKLAGKISDAQLRTLYENALCIGFPSRTEGFGLPPLEAMLLGCPAVVAPCGSLPEVCEDAALYADADDSSDWVVKIQSLYANEEVWQEARRKGQLQAQKFTWDNAAKTMLKALSRL